MYQPLPPPTPQKMFFFMLFLKSLPGILLKCEILKERPETDELDLRKVYAERIENCAKFSNYINTEGMVQNRSEIGIN